jgi:phage host-nuclease inhibitor protein Gam
MAKEVKFTSIDADKAAKEFFESQHELLKLNSEKNLAIHEVEESFKEETTAAQARLDAAEAILRKYCNDNKSTLLVGKAKSGVLGRVQYSFKDNKGSLVIIEEDKTWKDVLELVKEKLPDYVMSVDTLEKDKLLKDCNSIGEKLAACGLKVKSSETLSFKLKD